MKLKNKHARRDWRQKKPNANDRRLKKSPVSNVNKLRLLRKPPKRPLHWQRKRDLRL